MTTMNSQTLDAILHFQLRLAWAGEALCEPARLSWWRTDLIDPDSGGDLIRRLAPRTHAWASLEAAREAARLTDRKARSQLADPDQARTLFFWGFELDELLADRLREQKSALAIAPCLDKFDRGELERQFKALAPTASYLVQSTGRQMRGPRPEDPAEAARHLMAGLTPFTESYPAPFFRVEGA